MDITPAPLSRTTRLALVAAVALAGMVLTLLTVYSIRQALTPLVDDPVGLAAPLLSGERPENLLSAILLGGIVISAALALLTWRLGLLYNRLIDHNQTLRFYRDKDRRALQNGQIEKAVLHQALADSEQRTRDFVTLGDAAAFELDDQGCIGFLSPQIRQWINQEPVHRSQQPFEQLFTEDNQNAIRNILQTCRHGEGSQQADVVLVSASGEKTAVRLNVVAVLDPLASCQGFRGLLWEPRVD